MPFMGFKDFDDCVTKQKAKGLDDSSANKICGSLQSKTQGASLSEDEIITAVKNAIAYDDCIEKAKSYGHDDDAAKRICDQVTEDTEGDTKKTKDKGEEDAEPKAKKASIDEILDNIDSLLGGAEKKKKKQDDTEEEDLNTDQDGETAKASREEEETKEAYISTSQRDGDSLEGGDNDTIDVGSNATLGHRKNRLEVNPHKHDYGTDGPDFNHFGDEPVDEANTSEVDTYNTQQNSTLEGNDHIDTHMTQKHKKMSTQHLQNIPKESDNQSMQGLGQDTSQPETAGTAPSGANIFDKFKNAIDEFRNALSGAAHPKNASTVTKVASDKTIVTKETVNWIRNGTTYSA
jgi:hypothetical protein